MRVKTGTQSGSALNDAHGTSLDRALRRNKGKRERQSGEEREWESRLYNVAFNNGVSAVIFGTYLEHVRRRRQTCSGPLIRVRFVGARTPLAIRISLQMTWPPNYPSKVPKHASRNLAEDLTVRKGRDFTLGWNESFRVSHWARNRIIYALRGQERW